ncbi:hypothetical protein [Lysinibacillus sp. NPDC093692]|uniref:hypothetical protein n=1 Tax=Lysinibacillus sp. NPDC093692 TaxID=3390578 RepID=UPI003D03B7FE
MTLLRSWHVKIMMACIVALIVAVIGTKLFLTYPLSTRGIYLFGIYSMSTIGILALIVLPITLILAGRRFTPAPLNNFTTWVVIMMIGICILHWIDQDDNGFLMTLVTLDFVFMRLLHHDTVREYMIANDFTFFSYIVRIMLGVLYGVLLDAFSYFFKKIMKR